MGTLSLSLSRAGTAATLLLIAPLHRSRTVILPNQVGVATAAAIRHTKEVTGRGHGYGRHMGWLAAGAAIAGAGAYVVYNHLHNHHGHGRGYYGHGYGHHGKFKQGHQGKFKHYICSPRWQVQQGACWAGQGKFAAKPPVTVLET